MKKDSKPYFYEHDNFIDFDNEDGTLSVSTGYPNEVYSLTEEDTLRLFKSIQLYLFSKKNKTDKLFNAEKLAINFCENYLGLERGTEKYYNHISSFLAGYNYPKLRI